MQVLQLNITNMLGNRGKVWLSELPLMIQKLQDLWNLSNLQPVDNMTFNYVMKAVQGSHHPVVMKISPDASFLADEIKALQFLDGHGSVRLLNHCPKYHAVLLQQAILGFSLKALYPEEEELVRDAYVETMQAIHSKPLPDTTNFQHIRDWLTAIEQASPQKISANYLEKAILLKERLLKTSGTDRFLHGDLHHDNILKNGESWLSIDPKGVIGEAEFEIAAFDFVHPSELGKSIDTPTLFQQRVAAIATKSGLNAERILDWVFVRLILGAAWMIEDKGDPRQFIQLAERLF